MIYLQLFFEFFKAGLFSFGGGLATIPFLQEMAENTGWFTQAQLTDMIAISESTPGPIGINMATYVGFTTAGIPGGLVASLAVMLPSLVIALIIAGILARFKESTLVVSVFYGLRPASAGLIAAAGLTVLGSSLVHMELWKQTGEFTDLIDIKAVLLAIALFFLVNKIKIHPVVFLAGSAAVGVIFSF